MTAPSFPWFVHHIRDVIGSRERVTQVLLPTTAGGYVECWVRRIGDPPPWAMTLRARIGAAWWVLRGKAVALQWPRDGELDLAFHGKPNEPLREAVQPLEDFAGDAA